MSGTPTPTTYPYISCDPSISGGQPIVSGTRIPVATLARAHRLGMTFDDILAQYPGLAPAQLHAALLYYLDHLEAIGALIDGADSPPPGADPTG